jgi:hypothetical protein
MVKDLLLLPEFREFQLAAGEKGLDNRVTGTGIFEWESPEDIARDFRPGEFVVTTLSQMKEDPKGAEKVLLKLLESGISALGLKTVYYTSFTAAVLKRAEETNTPLFLFRDTFFDDIIYGIKSRLAASGELGDSALLPVSGMEQQPYVCIWSRQGSADRGRILPLSQIPEAPAKGFLGISDSFVEPEKVGEALQQSRIACISGILSGQSIRFFRDSGGDRLLVPASREPWAWDFYQELKGRIEGEKGEDKGEWMATLLTYGRFHGDIRQTAVHLFQHENTIRYRIRILRKRLGLTEDPDYYGVLYNFVRLHGIYEIWPL